jgi:hypothetical protein
MNWLKQQRAVRSWLALLATVRPTAARSDVSTA